MIAKGSRRSWIPGLGSQPSGNREFSPKEKRRAKVSSPENMAGGIERGLGVATTELALNRE
jgi:hypothetical protein